MALRHFLTLRDLSTLELNQILQRAIELKRKQHQHEVFQPFIGKVLGMIFEKSSTRTRVSFEAGIWARDRRDCQSSVLDRGRLGQA